MVLLVKIQEAAIVENLKKRYLDDLIFVSSLIHHYLSGPHHHSLLPSPFSLRFPSLSPLPPSLSLPPSLPPYSPPSPFLPPPLPPPSLAPSLLPFSSYFFLLAILLLSCEMESGYVDHNTETVCLHSEFNLKCMQVWCKCECT